MDVTSKSKIYNWSSTQQGKKEYDEWIAALKQTCNRNGIGHTVDETFANLFIPVEPVPINGNQPNILMHNLLNNSLSVSLQLVYSSFSETE